jgi:hypothetical protein
MRPTVTSYERRCEQCGPERRSMGRTERRCDKTKAHWVIAVSAISPPPYRSRIPICRSPYGQSDLECLLKLAEAQWCAKY